MPANGSVRVTANARPGSATVTTGRFFQLLPRALVLTASKRAPTAGPVAPSSQRQLLISGLNSGVRVTSATRS
ncbi:hypothetical protein U6N30_18865 [Blastococcus brunescens]|uniref:Uncharacterized protein n=1 Tax=Blastococcus brunescens TaxID=1564165 RepID=A0ABZ1AXH8_9ACTN|nr:hypothetical protein [Blastococcus sp. BMG 8361]WRL62108.1 hypothetical protein U6N30_18865 [Blastococcus sp. BMG 8361]